MHTALVLKLLAAGVLVLPAFPQTGRWVRNFQTDAPDAVYAVASHASGVYVAGEVRGALPGQTAAGLPDAFLRKYSLDGVELWTRQFGFTRGAFDLLSVIAVNGVVVDASGVYMAGSRTGRFIDRQGPLGEAFVRKYDHNGNLLWTFQPPTVPGVLESAVGVAVNATGVFVAGSIQGALPGQTVPANSGVVVRKLDATAGNPVWARQFGSNATAFGIAADESGAYVAGFNGTSGPLPGQTSLGSGDAFAAKVDNAGAVAWIDQFGTTNSDFAYAVAVNSAGIYVVGSTAGILAPPRPEAIDIDGFVRKYDSGGRVLWTRQFGTGGREEVYGATADETGVYLAGYIRGTFPEKRNYGGLTDAFLAKYDTSGNQQWISTSGSNADDYAHGVAVAGNAMYLAGYSGGGVIADPFLVRLDSDSPRGATPVISAVTNAASNAVASLPNSGIAQGSLFVVKGTDLGPATLAIATGFPLPTTLGGMSVKVTVGSVTRDAILYYATATQLAAILPSSVPVGRGTLTVTNNGEVSAAVPISVVRSTIGVYTVNQSGGGDAIATLGPSLVGPLNAANPGEAVAFWATGLGPVNFDETNAAQQFDMTDVPLEAWVAGKPARILFRGRNACCSSTDVIYVEIPAGVSGCVTPVVFKTGDYVSNTTSIPTALSGRVCTPSIPVLNSADVQSMLTKQRAASGVVGLFRSAPHIGAELGIAADGGLAAFAGFTPLPGGLGGVNWDMPPPGSCMVYAGGQFLGASLAASVAPAGSPITVTGPAGIRTLVANGPIGVFDLGGNFMRPGAYTATAPAGAEVGSYSANLTFANSILEWTNRAATASVDRGAGVTVTWTGGDPEGYVHIDGFATAQGPPAAGGYFRCTARTQDGRFTVPAYVTQALPPSTPSVAPVLPAAFPASLWVIGVSKLTRFQATGVEWGLMSQWVNNARTVSFTGAAGVPGN